MSLHFLRLEASRPVRNAKTEVLHLVVLLICCEVALRLAVALGHADRMHRTSRVSLCQKCQDPDLKVIWSCFFPSVVGRCTSPPTGDRLRSECDSSRASFRFKSIRQHGLCLYLFLFSTCSSNISPSLVVYHCQKYDVLLESARDGHLDRCSVYSFVACSCDC